MKNYEILHFVGYSLILQIWDKVGDKQTIFYDQAFAVRLPFKYFI